MNRFQYVSPLLMDNETTLICENDVKLYDGDNVTEFKNGELIITTHRILWGRPGAIAKGQTCLALKNELISHIRDESPSAFSFSSSRKVKLYLYEPQDFTGSLSTTGAYNFVKLSFGGGFTNDVIGTLENCLREKYWESIPIPASSQTSQQGSSSVRQIKLRTGIVGIERSLQEKQKATDASISLAFQDLEKLMTMAKDMVRISRAISSKIKEKQGDITEDETVRFKSYLLSLGIDDPVTRDSYKSNNQYYRSLAREVSDFLSGCIEDMGGMMALTDAFCRVNRARGLELMSPEDFLNACRVMESLELPLKLFQFSSGVMVLQLSTMNSEDMADATLDLIEINESLSSEELSQKLGISVTLAKERLLTTEKYGKCCRDDSIEGLRFYPNLFLTREE